MKSKKHSRADLRRRSTLFFQLGLIVVLLLSLYSIEWKTYASVESSREKIALENFEEEEPPVTVFEETPPPAPTPVIPDIIEIDPNDKVTEGEIESTEIDLSDIVEPDEIIDASTEEPIESLPFIFLEDVPVFPGCEDLKDNEARKECMVEKISHYINRNFNTGLGKDLGLEGTHRIDVMFEIDTEGLVNNIQVRAPHPKLKEEARRVVASLPQMQPGKQRGKPVNVSYSIPIIFKVAQ